MAAHQQLQRGMYPSPCFAEIHSANTSSGRSTPVPQDAPPSDHSISSARKQIRAEHRRRLFPTIEYASRVSHLDPTSDYRDFQGFYVLFWIALTIMAITTMLRNIKDTGYPMRVQIWALFTVKVWELGVADALMVASTAISLPLHRMFRNSSTFHWAGAGMAIQSIYQVLWLAFWVSYVPSPVDTLLSLTYSGFPSFETGHGQHRSVSCSIPWSCL
jgi:sterol O-acyltransferase